MIFRFTPPDDNYHVPTCIRSGKLAVRKLLPLVLPLRTPPTAKILQDDGAWIVCAQADRARRDALLEAGALVLEQPGGDGRVDLAALLAELGRRGINEVHVEAGVKLNGALLAAGLVDEWIAYLAPKVMGDPARGLFALPEYSAMAQCHDFRIQEVRQVGEDLRLTLRP